MLHGGFTCLYDPRHARLRGKLTEAEYFARDHVIVSYNADLRGIVEDLLGKVRKVRCSVSTFANLGALIDGTAMLATIPELVAAQIRATRPPTSRPSPCRSPSSGASAELIWPRATDDDEPGKFARAKIREIAKGLGIVTSPEARRRAVGSSRRAATPGHVRDLAGELMRGAGLPG